MTSDATKLVVPLGGLVAAAGGMAAWQRWRRSCRRDQEKDKTLPPLVSGGTWLLGHMPELDRADRFDVIDRWVKDYGSTFRVSLPVWYRCGFLGLERAHAVFVMSKEDQLLVMGSADGPFEKNISNSRLALHWHNLKAKSHPGKKAMSAMSLNSMKAMVPAASACAANFCDTIAAKDAGTIVMDANAEMKRVALDIMGRAQMSDFDMGAVSRDGPGHAIMEDLEPAQDEHAEMPYALRRLPINRLLASLHSFTAAGRRVSLANRRVDELAEVIMDHHDRRVASGTYDAGRDGFNLAEAVAAMGRSGYSHENCIYDLGTYMLTSNDIGERMGTCLRMLASQPHLQIALQREVKYALASCGVENHDVATADPALFLSSHPRLPLLNAVIRETLRLWVAPLTSSLSKLLLQISGGWTWRRCVQDGAVLGGFSVPRGWLACAPIYNSHRDSAAWGDDAHEFRPARWFEEVSVNDGEMVLKPEHKIPALFSPFGHGCRACPGQKFGYVAMRVTIATCMLRLDLVHAARAQDANTNEFPLEVRCL